MASLSAAAQTRTMIVSTASSEPAAIEVSTETHISFSNDLSKMIVSSGNADSPLAFDIDDIANIVFSLDSSVERPASDFGGLMISNIGGMVSISGEPKIRYSVWDIAGRIVSSGCAEESVTLDFSGRPAGVYVIKTNDKTLKFINR